MQRLFNVTKWRRLCEGQAVPFPSERPRVVRLEVNAPRAVGLYILDVPSGEMVFLARCEGRDTVEFHVGGAFSLVADGEVYLYTPQGETIHHVNEDPEIYTRITERRQRNPELDAIARAMNLNIERRLAAQRDEFNERIRVLQRDRALASRRAADEAAKPSGEGKPADDDPELSASEPVPDTASATGARDARRDKRGK